MLTNLATTRPFIKVLIPLQSLASAVIEQNHRVLSFTTTMTMAYKTTSISNENKIYLHVGPSGDSWIGDSIFAAKHNQPGYVKSIALVNDDNTQCEYSIIVNNDDQGSRLIEVLEDHPEWAQEIYDTECFPEALRQHLKLLHEEDIKS